jgi:hypothetical protein
MLAALTVAVALAATTVSAQVPNTSLIMDWVQLDYDDWEGSPWGSRAAAIESGAFIPHNNLATGLSFYNGTYFTCIPRWRPGVPATLNIALPTGNGTYVLRPFPSWDFNRNVLGYVQSIWIDQLRGHMYVIDTGRQNFFGGVPDAIINTSAKLHVLDLNDHNKRIYFWEFDADIFPHNTSFLNDIVVDTARGLAYMSDTNMDPENGAVVMHDLRNGRSRRFVDNSTKVNASYVAVVNNISYPTVRNPCDGIALSDDGRHLFYSAVQGASLYTLDALTFANTSASDDALRRTVRHLTVKPSFGDGLRFIAMRQNTTKFDSVWFGGMSQDTLFYVRLEYDDEHRPFVNSSAVAVAHSESELQWLDSFAKLPNLDSDEPWRCPRLLFSTNRLQLYFANTMDWSGSSGANMRLFWAETCWE